MSEEPTNVIEMEPQSAGQEALMASQRGLALSNVWLESCVAGVQQVMGYDYVVSTTGIQPRDGHVPTVGELTEKISNLARGTENTNVLKATIMWGLGDLCLMSGDDSVVEQAVKITGQGKHMVQQAIRLCKFFPPERRIPGWNLTMHVEVLNHAKRFADSPQVLEKVLEEAQAMAHTETVIAPDGTEITQLEHISCAELRKMLQEASGKPLGDGSRSYKPKFLYVLEDEDGVRSIKKSRKFSPIAAQRDIPIINLETLQVVNGANQGLLQELEGQWFPPEFEQEEGEFQANVDEDHGLE